MDARESVGGNLGRQAFADAKGRRTEADLLGGMRLLGVRSEDALATFRKL